MPREGSATPPVSTPPPPAPRLHELSHRARHLFGALLRHVFDPVYWWYERRLEAEVMAVGALPRHLGVILDGNRRFARGQNLASEMGHALGAEKAKLLIEWAATIGIPSVTIWVFSDDNRQREAAEVAYLYQLFADQARQMATDERIHNKRIRVRAIGDLGRLPAHVRESFDHLEQATDGYDGMQLYVALGYGGREEIVAATRKALRAKATAGMDLEDAARTLTAGDISAHLYAAGCPDPDFIIRTSGEVRLSGFLLWQSVYSEYYFCDVYWPAFRHVDFLRALRAFQQRQRRYGR